MFKQIKQSGRFNETIFLGSLSALCFGLYIFRAVYSGTMYFLFLNWNLFLAFLPWLLSSIFIVFPSLQKRKYILFGLIPSWLLFFPNAPYILTDLFHIRSNDSMPIWFDLVLILSYAWTGLLFGFMSLWDIEEFLSKLISKKMAITISMLLLMFGSFGIYVGRYLRWNSWDIVTQPHAILFDIGDRVANPFQHPETWGMTLFMFVFLAIVYWSFRFIKKRS
ncbi:MAG: DUF1361 domain-containing protein [Bacteroidales bacterium]|nr:DUF1361 domain-containing protein [Bacteroidales bacterium]